MQTIHLLTLWIIQASAAKRISQRVLDAPSLGVTPSVLRRSSVLPSIPRGGDLDTSEDYSEEEYEQSDNELCQSDNEISQCYNEPCQYDNEPSDNHLSEPPNRSMRKSMSSFSSSILSTLYPLYIKFVSGMRRGVLAGWDAAWCDENAAKHGAVGGDRGHGENDDRERSLPKVHSFLGKTGYIVQEVYRAALSDDDKQIVIDSVSVQRSNAGNRTKRRRRDSKRSKHKKHQRRSTSPTAIANGGAQMDDVISSLSQKYNVQTNPKHHSSLFTSSSTSLVEALTAANSDARMLICYISSDSSNDKKVMPTLLNGEFTRLLTRKPLGKKNIDDTGSFYIWICTAKSDTESAIKRLKLKPMNKKCSLSIIHPATTIDSLNRLKVSPKLLAQHHCNPPPSSAESMSAWVTSIRKRHLREYAKLQHDRKERILLRERSEGYKRSIVEDRQREEKEELELKKIQEEKEREEERLKKIEERREELLQNLGEEPKNGEDVITIALRFTNVSSTNNESATQRRFIKSDTVNAVFNWIDAMHGLERERISLTSMNGSKSFVYVEEKDSEKKEVEEETAEQGDVITLEEAGLSKMTALRVCLAIPDADKSASEGSTEE